MSESLTGGDVQNTDGLNQEPTGQSVQQQPAESQNQETTSNEQSQEAVSDDSSAQNNENKNNESGTQSTDDGLAKFAKSQGIEDLNDLSEREQKFLKIAHDNQRAARSQSNQLKIADVTNDLNKPKENATEIQKAVQEINQFRYEQKTNQFWSATDNDGKKLRDPTIEPEMVKVLNDAKEKHGADYARTLSQDLDTLYDLAQLRAGKINPDVAKEEGRREAITSIKQASAAGAPQAHAVTQNSGNGTKVDADWIRTHYDPSNAEHRELVKNALRGDLY